MAYFVLHIFVTRLCSYNKDYTIKLWCEKKITIKSVPSIITINNFLGSCQFSFFVLTRYMYVLSVASVSKLWSEQQYEANSYSCCGDYVIKHLNFDSLIVSFLAQNTGLLYRFKIHVVFIKQHYFQHIAFPHFEVLFCT